MSRHTKVEVDYPEWVQNLVGKQYACLRSAAEDAYYARALAVFHGAPHDNSCAQLMKAGEKSLKIMESASEDRRRCDAGERAARKFWEAKVCARSA